MKDRGDRETVKTKRLKRRRDRGFIKTERRQRETGDRETKETERLRVTETWRHRNLETQRQWCTSRT